MEHDFKLLETRQWQGGGGHIATEKCNGCGLVVKTSSCYVIREPAQRGNYDSIDVEQRAAQQCKEEAK